MKVEIKNLVPGYLFKAFDEDNGWVTVQVIEAGNGRVLLRDEDGLDQGWRWSVSIKDVGNIEHFKPIE